MANLFENISEKNILKLKRILSANTVKYKKNVNILSNVNPDNFIALVDSGSIQFIFNDYDGNKTIIEELNTGEMFGNLISNIASEEITCITKEDTQITYIEFDEITNDEIIKNDFYIIFIKNLIRLLTEQLTTRNNRIELLTKRSTRDKILAYFKYESQKRGAKKFNMPMTFTELANYLSVDRSAMSREIKYLKEDGFIEVTGRKITIDYKKKLPTMKWTPFWVLQKKVTLL